MALIDPKATHRIPIPHEPDQWVELVPVTARDIAQVQRNAEDMTKADLTLRILARCLKGWSYAAPINDETIASLDFETFNWLDTQVLLTGRRSEDEKKDLETLSSPISELEADGSLVTSGI